MRWHHVATAFPLTACLQLSTGDGTGTGAMTATSGGTTSSGPSSSPGGATSGTNCATDPQSGVTLCEQIANCPGVDVDPGSFAGCGFRLHATSTYDLECGCGESLCPIGAPTNCATAQQLLGQAQSSLVVCRQVSEETCLPLAVAAGSSPTSTCDKDCESQCGGDPNCIQLCGC